MFVGEEYQCRFADALRVVFVQISSFFHQLQKGLVLKKFQILEEFWVFEKKVWKRKLVVGTLVVMDFSDHSFLCSSAHHCLNQRHKLNKQIVDT